MSSAVLEQTRASTEVLKETVVVCCTRPSPAQQQGHMCDVIKKEVY